MIRAGVQESRGDELAILPRAAGRLGGPTAAVMAASLKGPPTTGRMQWEERGWLMRLSSSHSCSSLRIFLGGEDCSKGLLSAPTSTLNPSGRARF